MILNDVYIDDGPVVQKGVSMNITDVRVRKVSKEGKMKAVVSITIDDEFVVHDIKVIEGEKGLFIAMPSRKAADGEYRDIAHPINSDTRTEIQEIILRKYEETVAREDAEEYGARLQKRYEELTAHLPGVSAQARDRSGVIPIPEFYRRFTGCPGAPEGPLYWLRVSDHHLAAATNGEVFRDDLGAFTAIRRTLLRGYPIDVMRKKLAARLFTMGQAGQYNYPRCARRGDAVAMTLALDEFLRAALQAIYLLNGRYAPFYKWLYRGAEELPRLRGTVLALKNTVGMGSAASQAPKAKDAPFAGTYSSGAEAASTNAAPAAGAPEIWLPESKAAEAETAETPAEAPKSMEPLTDQITADTAVTGEAPVNAQVNAKAEERSFTLRLTALTDDGFEGAVTDGSDSGESSNLPLVTVLWKGDGAALKPGMLVIVTVSTAEQEESGVFRAIRVEPAEEP